ncbi:MAG: VWA domain-containing protein [Candidatus Hydrothermarchaeota archaeon]
MVNIANPNALIFLLIWIPVIILYLIWQKTKKESFSTLMFFLRSIKERKKKITIKRITHLPLLLLQLFILGLLVLSLANPYTIGAKKKIDEVIFIIDASASMNARDFGETRFEKAKEILFSLLDSIDGNAGVILAKNNPELIIHPTDNYREVKNAVNSLECKSTKTNIGDAILLANTILEGKKGKKTVYVLSDISYSQLGYPLEEAANLLRSNDINVLFLDINNRGKNIGIVGSTVARDPSNLNVFYTFLRIKNYKENSEEIKLNINLDKKLIHTEKIFLKSKEAKSMTYTGSTTLDAHILRFSIDAEDDFEIDNVAYGVLPEIKMHRVLLVERKKASPYLRLALESLPNVKLSLAYPPVIPSNLDDFDAVILGDVPYDYILPGIDKDLGDYVRKGGGLIVLGKDLRTIGLIKDILPVNLESVMEKKTDIIPVAEHQILKDVSFKNVFLERYIGNEPKNGSFIIAESPDKNPLISLRISAGKVVFMSFYPDKTTNFQFTPSFPVFWYHVVEWTSRNQGIISQKNALTGSVITANTEVLINDPRGVTSSLKPSTPFPLDHTGIYTVEHNGLREYLAVNLLDEMESDIAFKQSLSGEELIQKPESITLTENKKLWYPFILSLVMVFLLVEWMYYTENLI